MMTFKQEDNVSIDMMLPQIKQYLLSLQTEICQFAEDEEGVARFRQDNWSHHSGGGGLTCVMQSGTVFEKAGVNFSHVYGSALPQAATAKRPELANAAFQAMGVSVVMHPLNPYVPTSHFNVRFIMVSSPDKKPYWWFGGGFDLTPYYLFEEDCQHFHRMAKEACDPFGETVYTRYKKWADDYFYLKHRQEARGIGGIFFDDLNEWRLDQCFAFMQQVGQAYIKAYQPIVNRRKNIKYGERERHFQLCRRGRYVEFNLLYDRGTLFGLQSNGRVESILMSLPALVAWEYDDQANLGEQESALINHYLKQTRDWV